MSEIDIKEKTDESEAPAEKTRRPRDRENRKNRAKILKSRALLVFYSIVIVGAVAAVLLVAMFTFFKINTVNIEGSSLYTNEEILKAAGIKLGDGLLFADTKAAERRLEKELLYVEDVSLNKRIPSTLNIKITQAVPTYSVEYNGKYIYVSKGGKILEISSKVMSGSVVVKGGAVLESEGLLSFADEKVNSAFNELIKAINETGTAGIDYIDISNIFNITAEYDGRVTLKFGSSQDLEYKMKFAVNIINSENGIAADERGELDLSLARDTNKAYFSPEIYSNNEGCGSGGVTEISPGEEITSRGEDIPEP